METICNPIQVDNNDHSNGVATDDEIQEATGTERASGGDEMETLNNHHGEKESATTSTNATTRSSTAKQKPLRRNHNDDQKKVTTSNQLNDSVNIKIKRCKHGRIIIKDSSKKKLVQQGDIKETNPIQSKRVELVSLNKEKVDVDVSSVADQQVTGKIVGSNPTFTTITTAIAVCSNKTTNRTVDSPTGSDKVYGPKERDSNEVKNSSKSISHNDDNNNNNTSNASKVKNVARKTRSRSKSPSSRDRRRVSQSPPHRKSLRRYRDRSPQRRQRSKSPRRHESSRERGSWKISQEMSNDRSSSTRRNRSSARQDHSPPPSSSHRRDKRSPINRNRSSRRRYSESSSDGNRAVSPNNFSRGYRENSVRGIESRRDGYSKTCGIDISRDSIFGKSPTKTIDKPDKDSSSPIAAKETCMLQQLPTTSSIKPPLAQQSLPTTSTQASNCPPTKTSQPQASSEKSPLSEATLTPSTDGSIPSDIYDPEGPIISISPCDSPPVSPLFKAAKHSNNNNHNNNLIGKSTSQLDKVEKSNNEDDVPSSAVELNKKEKYLQKLNRQERVVEEIKIALKPHYQKRAISKEQYKDVLRRAVPKICHSKDGEINPVKIRIMVEAYVKKMKKKNR